MDKYSNNSFFIRYNFGHTQPTHSTLTPYARTRVHVRTHANKRLEGSLASSARETCITTERARVRVP
jgi:hypothetical protein